MNADCNANKKAEPKPRLFYSQSQSTANALQPGSTAHVCAPSGAEPSVPLHAAGDRNGQGPIHNGHPGIGDSPRPTQIRVQEAARDVHKREQVAQRESQPALWNPQDKR